MFKTQCETQSMLLMYKTVIKTPLLSTEKGSFYAQRVFFLTLTLCWVWRPQSWCGMGCRETHSPALVDLWTRHKHLWATWGTYHPFWELLLLSLGYLKAVRRREGRKRKKKKRRKDWFESNSFFFVSSASLLLPQEHGMAPTNARAFLGRCHSSRSPDLSDTKI